MAEKGRMTGDHDLEIRVRKATLQDLDTLVDFNAAMALESEGRALELNRLRSGVTAVFDGQSRGFYYVAEVSGRVAGQLLITTEWSDWRNSNFWWIQSVYVHPDHRRRGVYRTLHNHVVAEAHRQGNVCGIRLYVDRDNHRAKTVYASLEMGHSNYDLWEIDFVL